MVKNCVKTVNIGEGHLKRRNIMRSGTHFKALICPVLTRPESHKTVRTSSINGEKSIKKTVNVGGARFKRRNIGCSQARFKALSCAFLTSPESHNSEQKWQNYIGIFIKAWMGHLAIPWQGCALKWCWSTKLPLSTTNHLSLGPSAHMHSVLSSR